MDGQVLARVLDTLTEDGIAANPLISALFQCEQAVRRSGASAELGEPAVEDLVAAGLVAVTDERIELLVRIGWFGGLTIASDLLRHRRQRSFVVGAGPASRVLAAAVAPPRPGRVLDLGTGSGIQALLLARQGGVGCGIDISPRALEFARFNSALNGVEDVDFRIGDFLAPEPDRSLDGRFNTVVANPPFVLSPTNELTFRDRPLPGDETTRRTIERTARALAPGGRGYVLCNWIDRAGSWDGPARAWIRSTGLDGAAIRYSSLDAAAYATAWTRDLPELDRPAAIRDWAAALEAEGVSRIHLGIVSLARRTRRWPGTRRVVAIDRAAA
jgi:methylase of polypeptide subunit release factors